jgi:hypothetical protein
MSDELEGYTQEEFEAVLKMMGMQGVYGFAVFNGWRKPPMTPQARLELVNQYRANKDTPAFFFKDGEEGKYGDKRGDE